MEHAMDNFITSAEKLSFYTGLIEVQIEMYPNKHNIIFHLIQFFFNSRSKCNIYSKQ